MNHRFVTLKALETGIDADKTVTIDLDMADPISEIYIDSRVVNGAGAASTEHPILTLSKVEIIDGSDVLFSLNGPETEVLDIYHSGIFPRGGWFNYMVGTTTLRTIAISFGRYLWDEVLALTPGSFGSPQLRIGFDVDAGGMNPASCQLLVNAALFDEKAISPSGFLMTKEVKQWTGAANTHDYTDLPTDYPYRKLLLQSRYAGTPPHWIMSNIKLASDQDKKVILNDTFPNLMYGIGRENAFVKEILMAQGRTVHAYQHVTPTMDVAAVANQYRQTCQDYAVATWDGDGGRLEIEAEGNCTVAANVAGWAPHGTLCIPFGKQDEIDDWFNVSGIGNLKLDVTSGAATAVRRAFIQQYRPY